MEKVTKAFLIADIPLQKVNNTQIKNPFHDFDCSLLFETTCRKTVLQLSADESQWIRKAIHHKHIFLVGDDSILSGRQCLYILVGSLETPHVGISMTVNLYHAGCQTEVF